MSRSLPTVDELASYLSKSTLDSIIVEGDDDVAYLRQLESIIVDINVLPAGGKANVLSLLEKKDNFKPVTTFFVDADDWVIAAPPGQIRDNPDLFVTDGYSLENDLLRDAQIVYLLSAIEKDKLTEIVGYLSTMMAAAVSHSRDERFDFGRRLSTTFVYDSLTLTEAAANYQCAHVVPQELVQLVCGDPAKYFRGKTFLQILTRIFSERTDRRKIDVGSVLETAWTRADGLMVAAARRMATRLDERRHQARQRRFEGIVDAHLPNPP